MRMHAGTEPVSLESRENDLGTQLLGEGLGLACKWQETAGFKMEPLAAH